MAPVRISRTILAFNSGLKLRRLFIVVAPFLDFRFNYLCCPVSWVHYREYDKKSLERLQGTPKKDGTSDKVKVLIVTGDLKGDSKDENLPEAENEANLIYDGLNGPAVVEDRRSLVAHHDDRDG